MTSPRLVLWAAVAWAGRELDQDAGRAVERELARARVPPNLEQVRESLLKQADAEEKSAEEWQRKTSMLGGPSSLLEGPAQPVKAAAKAPAKPERQLKGMAEFRQLHARAEKQLQTEKRVLDRMGARVKKHEVWAEEDEKEVKEEGAQRLADAEEWWKERKADLKARGLPGGDSLLQTGEARKIGIGYRRAPEA